MKLCIILLLCLISSFCNAQTNADKATEKYTTAILLEDRGNYKEALALLLEAEKLDNKNIDITYEKAYCYYIQGDYKNAIVILEKIINNAKATEQFYQLLGNSYDPNDKLVARPNETQQMFFNDVSYLDIDAIEKLTYTVRFQNTGTAPAQNIYILDTLSSNLNWSSFSLIESSHPMQVVNLGNGILRFEFSQIWLADSTTNEEASHGHLVYSISENASILGQAGIEIENTAYIFFDWNEAIVTNTTYNINEMFEGVNETNNTFIELGFWPGGDRDGNPNVQADTTLKVAAALRSAIVVCYYRDIRRLKRKLTFSGVDVLMLELESLLYENVFRPSTNNKITSATLLEKLQAIKNEIKLKNHGLFISTIESLINKVKLFASPFYG